MNSFGQGKAIKKKKRMSWVCNNCDAPQPSKDAVIAHYRREHPADGWGLWDICGTTGDNFADSTANAMWERLKEKSAKLQDAEQKAKLYEGLLERWNALCRALHIGQQAMDAYRDAHEKKQSS